MLSSTLYTLYMKWDKQKPYMITQGHQLIKTLVSLFGYRRDSWTIWKGGKLLDLATSASSLSVPSLKTDRPSARLCAWKPFRGNVLCYWTTRHKCILSFINIIICFNILTLFFSWPQMSRSHNAVFRVLKLRNHKNKIFFVFLTWLFFEIVFLLIEIQPTSRQSKINHNIAWIINNLTV